MALIECSECKKPMFDKAAACPSCSAPIAAVAQKPTAAISKSFLNSVLLFLAVIIGVPWAMVKCTLADNDVPAHAVDVAKPASPLTPVENALEKKQAADANIAVEAAKQLRDAMRNPSSFVLEWAQTMDSGAVCMTYRAQNGFGGYSRENAVLPHTRDSIVPHASQSLWKKECEKGASRNVTTFIKTQL